MPKPYRAAVVTVSDGVSQGTREDASGELAAGLLAEAGFEVTQRRVVADERADIEALLSELGDAGAALVVTTGGTGFGPRDVTPEATKAVLDREAPGLVELMLRAGLDHTPNAALSRAAAGSRGATLILNTPGSPKGVRESLEAVLPVVPHAIDLLSGATGEHSTGHAVPDKPAGKAGTVTVTAVKVLEGSPPCAVGSRIEIGPGGPLSGTLGCAEFDAAAVADVPDVLTAGTPQTRTYHHDLGDIEVFLEPHLAPARLLVFGATPVALELLRLARALGYSTTLVESRTDRLTPGLRAQADSVSADAAEAVAAGDGLASAARTDAVFTDHDAPDVAADVAVLLGAPTRFVGVMGSRRHVAPHRNALRSMGVADEDLDRVRSPVGLNIGAATPVEIALSIAAGLIASREGRDGEWMDREPDRDPG